MSKYSWEFWAVPKRVVQDETLKAEEKILLGMLCTLANGDNRDWPGTSYLAKLLKCKPKTVRYYIQSLEDRGWIKVKRNNSEQVEEFEINIDGVAVTNGIKKGGVVPGTPDISESQPHTPLIKEEEILQSGVPPVAPETSLNSELKTQLKEMIDFYYRKVQEIKHFKPVIDGADGSVLKRFLKNNTTQNAKSLIVWYLRNEKSEKNGVTLKAMFSTHSQNLWRQHKAKIGL